MPSTDLGIAKVSFEVNYPTIDCEVDLEIAHLQMKLPEVGGRLDQFDEFQQISICHAFVAHGVLLLG